MSYRQVSSPSQDTIRSAVCRSSPLQRRNIIMFTALLLAGRHPRIATTVSRFSLFPVVI